MREYEVDINIRITLDIMAESIDGAENAACAQVNKVLNRNDWQVHEVAPVFAALVRRVGQAGNKEESCE